MARPLELYFQIYKQGNMGEEYIDIYSREQVSDVAESPLKFIIREKRDFTQTLEESISESIKEAMKRGIISKSHHVSLSEICSSKKTAFRYESPDVA